ncbi:MAG: hypothetical protein AAB663_02785 [Patescibacteria group bacterium]
MSRIVSLLVLVTGCAQVSAFSPSDTNFHVYTDLDYYCTSARMGDIAVGYRVVNPWVDEVLCMGKDGLMQIDAPKTNGLVDRHVVSNTTPKNGVYWAGNRVFHVALKDYAALMSCPGQTKPLVVIGRDVEVNDDGAYIRDGAILCMEGDDLTLRNAQIGSLAPEISERWPNFTPIIGE